MRAVVQRVAEARVVVDGAVVGEVGRGYLVLVCAMEGDTDVDLDWMLRKIVALRVFPDEAGKMNLAITALPALPGVGDGGVGVLVVSQFTLSAALTPTTAKGNRPAFTGAMAPAQALALVERFVTGLRTALQPAGVKVAAGIFGADMKVGLVNDGPVTLWLDSRTPASPGLDLHPGPTTEGTR